jgi:hypothetical protein
VSTAIIVSPLSFMVVSFQFYGGELILISGGIGRIHYVNSYPITAMKYGIQELSPTVFSNTGGKPQIALVGPNVGCESSLIPFASPLLNAPSIRLPYHLPSSFLFVDASAPAYSSPHTYLAHKQLLTFFFFPSVNTGKINLFSGTTGATVAAVSFGIPGIAFSGSTIEQVSYLNPGPNSTYANVYAQLAGKLTDELLKSWKGPAGNYGNGWILPAQTWVNVNFSPSPRGSGECKNAADFKYIFTRMNEPWFWMKKDVTICGNKGRLQDEQSLVKRGTGCWASVSVGNMNKLDAGSKAQGEVYQRLKGILTCTTPDKEDLVSKVGRKVGDIFGFGP